MTLVKFNHSGRDRFPFNTQAYYGDVFNKIFSDTNHWPDFGAVQTIPVNVSETEDKYVIEIQAAGYQKEDFQIEVKEDKLSVSTEKKEEKTEGEKTDGEKASETKNYTRKEFSKTAFTRSFNLPEAADQNSLKAAYANGILEITIAKKEEEKLKKVSRKIEIS